MAWKNKLMRRAQAVTAAPIPQRRRTPAHPLEHAVWNLARAVVFGCVAAWGAHRLLGGENALGLWLTAVVALLAWLTAIRLLLLDARARRFWIVWLALSLLFVVVFKSEDEVGLVLGVVMVSAFLFLRRYRPYRNLTSAQRAHMFVLGVIALGFASIGWHLPDPEELPAFLGHGRNLTLYALSSLRIFWVLSLLAIFVRMRLHHLRLKPKLAVSALFIALVPTVLVLVLAAITLLGALGGSRAVRGQAILRSWAEQVDQGIRLTPVPFGRRVVADLAEQVSVLEGESPEWLPGFRERWLTPVATADSAAVKDSLEVRLGSAARDEGSEAREDSADADAWAVRDTTAYFSIGQEIWLLRVTGTESGRLHVEGYDVDSTALNHLSSILHCSAGLYGSRGSLTVGYEPQPNGAPGDTTQPRLIVRGRHGPPAVDASHSRHLWYRDVRVGAAMLSVIQPSEAGLFEDTLLLYITASLHELAQEYTQREYRFNQMLLYGFIVEAVFFLIIIAVALFFGIRIATGITGAVAELRQGTVRLAAGDLDTHIEVPNEDELGDLADAFNEMTGAVKRGRERAVEQERMVRELETARAIQQRLLPRETPSVPGFEISGTSVSSLQVGGDYFDFLDQGEGRLGIAIGDVSGKGMPAALLMANLQASLQGQVIHPSSVAEVVQRVNTLMVRSTDSKTFATFFYGVLDRSTATFTCTNAGHNPPILCRADGSIELLRRGGLLIGMLRGVQYEQETLTLNHGDVVVLYTDGISEAEGPVVPRVAAVAAAAQASGEDAEQDEALLEDDSNMFGEERLTELVRRSAHFPAAGIREAILTAVTAHAAGVPQSDDITLVVIKRQAGG